MRNIFFGAVVAASTLLVAGAASAQTYTAAVYGSGSGGNCSRYKMTLDATVAGNQITGTFQQDKGLKDERPQRNFAVAADGAGNFRGTAMLGEGARMAVSGSLKPTELRFKLDGYCVFDFKVPRKP